MATNGETLSSEQQHALETFRQTLTDPFTESVVNATAAGTPERARLIMASLTRHLHAFAREVKLTTDEWMIGVDGLNRAGKMTDDRRNEGILVSDTIGLEALVDQITQEVTSAAGAAGATPETGHTLSAILGPFYREGAPKYPNGSSIILKTSPDDETAFMHGRVLDSLTGEPLAGVEMDIWETAVNGLYEQQDPEQPDYNLRGNFTTDQEGRYSVQCLRPTSYPIPYDGPAGDILKVLGRSPMRPAHIHLLVKSPGYTTLITQIYDSRDEHVKNDAVFAVKDSLVVDFVPTQGGKTKYDLQYDIKLAKSIKQ